MTAPAAFGLRAHSGWAVLVTVAGSRAEPTLLDRRRIELASRTPAQPYHEAAKLNDLPLAAALIERARADARQRAQAAIAAAVAAARQRGYEVQRAAVLMNAARPLPTLDAILASHPLLHTAEGALFREALAHACEHRRLAVARCSERDVYESSGRSLAMPAAALRTRVAALGRLFGSPWTADHKAAFVAGWNLLAD